MRDPRRNARVFRVVVPFGAGILTLIAAVNSFAQVSEIDGFDRAITSGGKQDALAFIDGFGSSHLIPDLIELLPPAVAAAVCADLPSGASSAANRACEQLRDVLATAPAAGTVAQEVVTTEEGDLFATEEVAEEMDETPEELSFQHDALGSQDGNPSSVSGNTSSGDSSSGGDSSIGGEGTPALGLAHDLEQRVRDVTGVRRPGS
jgi:hypothetical protein